MSQPLRPFGLERYLAPREFKAKHALCSSDAESWNMCEIMDQADDDIKAMWRDLRLGYTTTEGLEELRQEIAASQFARLSADDLVLDAPGDAMYCTMQALLRSGDHVVCTYPGYQSLFETARSIGCELSFWHMDCRDAAPQFELDELRRLVKPGVTRMIVVNFPHNPSGFLPSLEQWKEVAAVAAEVGAYLFSDEMYRGMEFDVKDRLPAAADTYDKGISLGGLSKNVGMPGLRIGWIGCRDAQVIQRVKEVKDYTTICNSAPSEVVALAALRRWDTIMERQMELLTRNAALLSAFGRRWSRAVDVYPVKASTTAFLRWKVADCSVHELSDGLLREQGTFVLPGAVYDADLVPNRFRMGFGRADFPQALACLEAYLDAHFAEYKSRGEQ